MSKTPISILQELVVQKKQSLPDYYIENCSIPGTSFKCTVTVCSIKAIGYASTKKDAKQNSAKRALEILGYNCNTVYQKEIPFIINCSTKQTPCINYVGKLNELASTQGKPYPVYHDKPMPDFNGNFLTLCNFLNFCSEGYGLKKKDSKQDAAKNMLELLKDKDIGSVTVTLQNIHHEKSKKVEALTQEVIKNYDRLTISVNNSRPELTTILSIPSLRKTVFSLEDVKRELEKYGYNYTIETFQKEPYIMMMKIRDTNVTIMGKGKNKVEALNDLFENAVLMFDNGYSLKTDF